MSVSVKSSPETLMRLTKQMEEASEDLRRDATEIQYLLSQFDDAITGKEITQSIDGVQGEIDHCNRLCDTLRQISGELRKIHDAYLETEELTIERINQGVCL